MPDLKISQLPAASTPLAGTELVPVVQGGITEQTPVQSLMTSTVPSGTANGVMYLNGSKVATTGSALTFDGTNLVVGASSAAYASAGRGVAEVNGSSQSLYGFRIGGTAKAFLLHDGTTLEIVNAVAGGNLLWGTAGVERMRLDSSGNLGIGTSSPGATLDVRGSMSVALQSTSSFAAVRGFTAGSGNLVLQADAGSGSAWWLSAKNSGILAIGGNGGSEPNGALNIDGSGNLGLGVTPSAIGYGTMFQIAQGPYGGALTAQALDVDLYPVTLSANAVTSAANTWKYVVSGSSATRYEQVTGKHVWYTAPSGTAGNAITFTQAMTLDASGNLGVGTTSPSSYGGKLNVYAGDVVIADAGTSSGSSAPRIGSSSQALVFKTNSGGGSASEVARFDGSGNFINKVNGTAPSLTTNSTMSFELTSNTSLKIVVRGTDGVTRSASLTLA